MSKKEISVLIGEMTDQAHRMGAILNDLGCKVIYSAASPLDVQFEVIRSHPDAVIITKSTKYPKQLCENLKSLDQKPYIVLLCHSNEKYLYENIGNLIDNIIYGKCSKDELFSIIYAVNALIASKPQQALQASCEFPISIDTDNATLQEKKDILLHNSVTAMLNKLCVTPNYNGYIYIREAIKIAVQISSATRGITKLIYPQIAQSLGVTSAGVERSIRTAIHRSWFKVKQYEKAEYFGTYALQENWVPTNSEYIFILADRINCYINTAI